MLHTPAPSPSQTPDDREARIQALLACLRPHGEQVLRQMAERLVDLPEGQAFGQLEYDLRDLAHELAASAHQAGLEAGKKRGTRAPASSARTAGPTPATSPTGTRPGGPSTGTSATSAPTTTAATAARATSPSTRPTA